MLARNGAVLTDSTRLTKQKLRQMLVQPLELARGVAAIGEDGLPGNPPALSGKELDDGHNVLDLGQLAVHGL
jgi:hypothetical protein